MRELPNVSRIRSKGCYSRVHSKNFLMRIFSSGTFVCEKWSNSVGILEHHSERLFACELKCGVATVSYLFFISTGIFYSDQ